MKKKLLVAVTPLAMRLMIVHILFIVSVAPSYGTGARGQDALNKKISISVTNTKLKTVLDVDLKYNDSRAHGGIVYCEATKQGIDAGLPNWWMAPFPVSRNQVDIVLGENVNNDASAYVKKYSSKQNSGLIQLWIDSDFAPADINFVKKIAVASF